MDKTLFTQQQRHLSILISFRTKFEHFILFCQQGAFPQQQAWAHKAEPAYGDDWLSSEFKGKRHRPDATFEFRTGLKQGTAANQSRLRSFLHEMYALAPIGAPIKSHLLIPIQLTSNRSIQFIRFLTGHPLSRKSLDRPSPHRP